MKKYFSILVAATSVFIAGCSSKVSITSDEWIVLNWYNQGLVRIFELPKSTAKEEGYDLKASVISATGNDLDLTKASDRRLVIQILRPDCLNPEIVGEHMIPGESPVGVNMSWYYMDIKCKKGV